MDIRNPILFSTVARHISKLSIPLLRIVARLFLIYHLENSIYSRDIAIFLPEEYRDLYQIEIFFLEITKSVPKITNDDPPINNTRL